MPQDGIFSSEYSSFGKTKAVSYLGRFFGKIPSPSVKRKTPLKPFNSPLSIKSFIY